MGDHPFYYVLILGIFECIIGHIYIVEGDKVVININLGSREAKDRLNKVWEEDVKKDRLIEENCEGKYLDLMSSQKNYSLMATMSESWDNYEFIVRYCLENNINGVVDIGCAYGFQGELFDVFGIDYIGVDCIKRTTIVDDFNKGIMDDTLYRSDDFTYIYGYYPEIILPEYTQDYLGVSSMCLTWLCRSEDELIKSIKGLQRDFKKSLVYYNKKHMGSKYNKEIKGVTNIGRGFIEIRGDKYEE